MCVIDRARGKCESPGRARGKRPDRCDRSPTFCNRTRKRRRRRSSRGMKRKFEMNLLCTELLLPQSEDLPHTDFLFLSRSPEIHDPSSPFSPAEELLHPSLPFTHLDCCVQPRLWSDVELDLGGSPLVLGCGAETPSECDRRGGGDDKGLIGSIDWSDFSPEIHIALPSWSSPQSNLAPGENPWLDSNEARGRTSGRTEVTDNPIISADSSCNLGQVNSHCFGGGEGHRLVAAELEWRTTFQEIMESLLEKESCGEYQLSAAYLGTVIVDNFARTPTVNWTAHSPHSVRRRCVNWISQEASARQGNYTFMTAILTNFWIKWSAEQSSSLFSTFAEIAGQSTMQDVAKRLRLSAQTAARAVSLFDRSLSNGLGKDLQQENEELALVATVCIWVAAKLDDSSAPELSFITALHEVDCDDEKVRKMEVSVLRSLGWRVLGVTAADFLESMLAQLTALGQDQEMQTLLACRCEDIMRAFILPEVEFLAYRPSVISFCVMQCLLDECAPTQAAALMAAFHLTLAVDVEARENCYGMLKRLLWVGGLREKSQQQSQNTDRDCFHAKCHCLHSYPCHPQHLQGQKRTLLAISAA